MSGRQAVTGMLQTARNPPLTATNVKRFAFTTSNEGEQRGAICPESVVVWGLCPSHPLWGYSRPMLMIRIHVRRQPSELRCLKVHFKKTLPAKNQQLFSFRTIGLCVVKLSHCRL